MKSKSNLSKSKRIALDMLINLIGTGFPLAVLQLIIYPIVAQIITSSEYGEMQSTMSLIYLIGGTLGGSLSTTRLIREYEYTKKKIAGDYNGLFLGSFIAVIIITWIVSTFYLENNSIDYIILVVLVALGCFAANYLEVGFRLQLNYKRIFFAKVLSCIGYAVGFSLFYYTHYWQFIFIFSFAFVVSYCLIKTNLIREPIKKTELFNGTIKSFGNLGIANLLNKALTYFDKLIVFPLLGGEAVSIYFAANIFGKLILQVLEPITNVILSYLSKKDNVEKHVWKITVIIGGIFCIIMYFVCMIISGPILGIFYPQWQIDAMELIPIATASLCISSFISIIYPLSLKALPTNRQIIINGGSLIVYIICVLLMYSTYGLFGCCLALLISYITQLIIILFFCIRNP